jgi:hypothetical protein
MVLRPMLTSASPAVSFTYAAPKVQQDLTAMRFGEEATGSLSKPQTLVVSNDGSAPLIVSGVVLEGRDPDDFVVGNRCQEPVAPGASCHVGVRFAPQQQGARSATLTLLTNAVVAPEPVKLSGGKPGELLRAHHAVPRRSALISCPARIAVERGYRAGAAVCAARSISGEIELTPTRAVVSATLTRGRLTYATGVRTSAVDGSSLLMLDEHRKLGRGAYMLVLRGRRRGRWASSRQRVVVSLASREGKAPRLGGLVF